jgi:pimeloyl-ACP methyl ester carboxylesterase
LAALAAIASSGCFAEKSIPMLSEDFVRVTPRNGNPDAAPESAREWVARVHPHLARLLPRRHKKALLTDDLLDSQGRPIDVLSHFDRRPERLESLFWNFSGLLHSAQAVGQDEAIEEPAPLWEGFKEVWVPISDDFNLSARVGWAERDGKIVDSDCIIILPGIYGDNSIWRTRELALALRSAGFHVLSVELRGHGQTEARYPDVFYNFGVREACDLMTVDEWLKEYPHINRTGIASFCWGGNEALLAAWFDGRDEDHPSITDRVTPFVRPVGGPRHFEAGIIAIAPVLRFEELLDELEVEHGWLTRPILRSLQGTVRGRMERKGYGPVSGSLRKLIDEEFAHSEMDYSDSVEDALRFLRMLPYKGKPDGRKLEWAAVPLLIVQSANDPLTSGQNVADLVAVIDNPNVAAVVIPGGGHIGVAPYARSYYYSLILNFFDSDSGPRAVPHVPNSSSRRTSAN